MVWYGVYAKSENHYVRLSSRVSSVRVGSTFSAYRHEMHYSPSLVK